MKREKSNCIQLQRVKRKSELSRPRKHWQLMAIEMEIVKNENNDGLVNGIRNGKKNNGNQQECE